MIMMVEQISLASLLLYIHLNSIIKKLKTSRMTIVSSSKELKWTLLG